MMFGSEEYIFKMINKLIIVFISSIFTCYATFQPDDSSVVVFVSLVSTRCSLRSMNMY